MINPEACFQFTKLETEASGAIVADWIVPKDLPYFEGHFPNHPVLPAVAVIDATVEFLRATGAKVQPSTLVLKKAKFTALILPGTAVQLTAERKAENRWVVEWRNRNAWQGAKFESMCSLTLDL